MYRIGIDLGGTNIAVGVIDENLKIIGRGLRKTNAPRPYEQVFADIIAAAEDAIRDAGITVEELASIGLGTPGSVDKAAGLITYANNLDFRNVPAAELLQSYFGRPVYIENDANAAALGECRAGAGEGCDSFVMITLGTGVGSGIIVDGKVIEGVNFAAGEMGHMVIRMDGELCSCGRRGCWESYASARALVRQTKDSMQHDQGSVMWDLAGNTLSNVNGRTAFDAMRKGDPSGKKVVDTYIRYVAVGLINIINTFQPAMICIGGGIANEKETLMAPLRKYTERERYSLYARKQTRLIVAELGNDAGIYGAALLER